MKPIATAFLSLNKKLAIESRLCTLGLYRSLLQTSQSYVCAPKLKEEIRKRFKENVHTTSRPRCLSLMQEAEKTLIYLQQGISGDKDMKQKIMTFAKNLKLPKKKAPVTQQKKKPKMVERKPYQVAITTRTAFGYEFKRVRGWRQPVQTSMMMKNRVKVLQARLDRFNMFKEQLYMIRSERLFLQQLNCLPKDRLMGFEDTIKLGLDVNSKHALPSNKKDEELVDTQ